MLRKLKELFIDQPKDKDYLYQFSEFEDFDFDKWDEQKDPEVVDWKRVRSAMEHENHLSLERARMLTTSQAFLFAAYFLIYTEHDNVESWSIKFLLALISIIAVFISVFIFLGMKTARVQHTKLERWWSSRIGAKHRVDGIRPTKARTRHPPLCGKDPDGFFGLKYLRFHHFPLFFLLTWASVFLYTLLGIPVQPAVQSEIHNSIASGEVGDTIFFRSRSGELVACEIVGGNQDLVNSKIACTKLKLP